MRAKVGCGLWTDGSGAGGVAAWVLAAMSLALPGAGFAQVAGPGASNPANLPGQPIKPPGKPTQPLPEVPSNAQVQAVVAKMTAAGILHPATVPAVRRAYAFYAQLAGEPEQVARVENRTVPGPAAAIPIRVYAARTGTPLPMFLFFHGGEFVTGDLDMDDVPLRAVANRCECLVVSVEYRLAPDNPYPAAPEDAYAATKWVAEHAAELGGDPQRIAVGGDGAGGNLAAVVTLMARDRGGPRLAFQVLIYPLLDAAMLTQSWITADDPVLNKDGMLACLSSYVPVNTNPEMPYISPLQGDQHRLPPALIITSTEDPVRDEDQEYVMGLKAADVPAEISVYSDAIHGFFLMPGALDAGKRCIEETATALKHAFAANG